MSRSFIDCKLFSILTNTSRGPSAIAELLVRFALTFGNLLTYLYRGHTVISALSARIAYTTAAVSLLPTATNHVAIYRPTVTASSKSQYGMVRFN